MATTTENAGVSLPKEFVSSKFYSNKKLRKSTMQNPSEFDNLLFRDFNKKFSFKILNWELPNAEKLYKETIWQNDELIELKDQLNNEKSVLNEFNLKDWYSHTHSLYNSFEIVSHLKFNIRAEFVTQAWCKFYEIISNYELVPKDIINNRGIFNSVHLCEAPGAFITSLNHYLKLNYPYLNWNWIGTTLNPYYEENDLSHMINDDRFIFHTLENWRFGYDMTGDIFNKKNLEDMIAFTSENLSPVNLVTADGSIDCQNDPGEQERIVLDLHYAETITALNILEKGGSFVMKIFTVFECESICLLYLLCNAFESVNIFKPNTSKGGNSEVYVICLSYKGKDNIKNILDVLNMNYDNKKSCNPLFAKNDIPNTFFEQIQNCSKFFTDIQIEILKRNISTYNDMSSDTKQYWENFKTLSLKKFISLYNIKPLNRHNRIIDAKNVKKNDTWNLSTKAESLSLREKNLNDLDKLNLIKSLSEVLDSIIVTWIREKEDIYIIPQELRLPMNVNIYKGKPIKIIKSSKFCYGALMKIDEFLNKFYHKNDIFEKFNKRVIKNIEEIDVDNIRVCDLSSINWTNFVTKQQIIALAKIMFTLEKLNVGESFILTGYPLLTCFNVSVFHCLKNMFDKVAILNPEIHGYVFIFIKLINSETKDILQKLLDEENVSDDLSVLSAFSITELYNGDMYKIISTINNIVLKETSLRIIKQLKE